MLSGDELYDDETTSGIMESLAREDAYFRLHENDPEPPYTCNEQGHVYGCPGAAGGDHELIDDPELNPEAFLREGQPEFNGAFNRW